MRYYEMEVEDSGLYRSRDGWIFGVCGGFAEYLDTSPGLVRVLAVIAMLLTGFWPAVFVYIVLALLMKKDPYVRI